MIEEKSTDEPCCLICKKTFNDYYCEECSDKAFHKAHHDLLKGYMKHKDPLKEIKRILYGEKK